jgi:hypothetical protein
VDNVVPLDWNKIAGRTEGYVLQDLVDLTDKAIFQAYKKAGISVKPNLISCYSAFGKSLCT